MMTRADILQLTNEFLTLLNWKELEVTHYQRDQGPYSQHLMEQCTLKVNYYLYTNIYYYLETSGGLSSNPYLNVVHFLTPVLFRHLWQLKAVFSCIGV